MIWITQGSELRKNTDMKQNLMLLEDADREYLFNILLMCIMWFLVWKLLELDRLFSICENTAITEQKW